MRFKKLHLQAFGPFTDQIIDFGTQSPGLHVVYGPNEAGKSSALRALRALLFGFEERTVDNFLHSNPKLLVGGVVEDEAGNRIEFYRRKKRVADLVDAENNPLDESLTSRLMPGIGKELFISLYGIDHRMLVAGGEEILARRGEVGQALFTAGSGIASLSKVLAGLEEEASDLFKSRGSKQQINRAVAAYQDLKKTARDESLLPARYEAHEKSRKQAQAERLRLEEESHRVSSEIERLNRLNRIIPELAELDHHKRQLEAHTNASRLPAGFADRTARIEQEIETLIPQIQKLKKRYDALRQRTQRMSPDPEVLGQAAAIEDLHQRLGQYRAGGRDRLKLDRDRAAQRRDAGLLIESIDPQLSLSDADALSRTLGRGRAIQRLCSTYEGLDQRLTLAARNKRKLGRLLDKKNEKLSRLAPHLDTGGLATATERGRSVGDIDAQIDGLMAEIETVEKGCVNELGRLGLWDGGLVELEKTPFPLRATLQGFDKEYRDLERQADRFELEQKRLATESEEAQKRLAELLKGNSLPSEGELLAVREKRQQGWLLIRRSWLGGEELVEEIKGYDQDLSLDSAYEKQVEKADRMADLLREEADRSAQVDALNRQLELLHREIAALAEKQGEAERHTSAWQKRWMSIWRELGIEPLTPAEMLDWLDQLEKLRFKLSALFTRKQEYSAKLQKRSSLVQTIADELKKKNIVVPGGEQRLAPVLESAESVLADAVDANQYRRSLAAELATLENEHSRAAEELEEAEREMERWRQDWSEALTHLPVAQQITTDEAVDLLKIIDDCAKKLDAARGFASRIEGIDRDRERFEKDVQQLAQEIDFELENEDPEQAVLKLYDLLGRSKEEKQLLGKDQAALDELSGDLAAAEKRLAELNEQMTSSLVEAGCRDRSELTEAVERSKRLEELIKRIEAVESSIAKLSEGVDLATIRKQAAAIDVDEVRSLIPSLKRRLDEELAPRISELGELIGAENRELALMDGRSRAAEAAERMEQEGAVIQRLVDRYVTVTLASLVLKREIERYREAHQDPVLKMGSEIFAGLTLGSFTELLTDVDERGNPVINGRKSDGSAIGVESMSDGTRDQLYLALRLATLYFRLQKGTPMPFIVDDILVNFDDQRSGAALKALAELAGKNQVILFTHHEKIVDQAETLDTQAEIVIHRLAV